MIFAAYPNPDFSAVFLLDGFNRADQLDANEIPDLWRVHFFFAKLSFGVSNTLMFFGTAIPAS